MANKPIFQQTAMDFNKGKCRIAKNYWGEVWHITTLDHHTILRAEGKTPFETKEAARKAAERAGLEIVEEEYSFYE